MSNELLEQRDQTRSDRLNRVQDRLDIDNVEAVPTLEKVVVNTGLGEARNDASWLENCKQQLREITAQEPIVTRAKKSVAGFGIRKGDPIGLKVTLREGRMQDFVDRLIHIALPQTKDFQGLDSNSFDGQGNYTIGLEEHVVFPEISYDQAENTFGMDITFVTTTTSDDEAYVLLDDYGVPLQSE